MKEELLDLEEKVEMLGQLVEVKEQEHWVALVVVAMMELLAME